MGADFPTAHEGIVGGLCPALICRIRRGRVMLLKVIARNVPILYTQRDFLPSTLNTLILPFVVSTEKRWGAVFLYENGVSDQRGPFCG